jgi:hypothetical protein
VERDVLRGSMEEREAMESVATAATAVNNSIDVLG